MKYENPKEHHPQKENQTVLDGIDHSNAIHAAAILEMNNSVLPTEILSQISTLNPTPVTPLFPTNIPGIEMHELGKDEMTSLSLTAHDYIQSYKRLNDLKDNQALNAEQSAFMTEVIKRGRSFAVPQPGEHPRCLSMVQYAVVSPEYADFLLSHHIDEHNRNAQSWRESIDKRHVERLTSMMNQNEFQSGWDFKFDTNFEIVIEGNHRLNAQAVSRKYVIYAVSAVNRGSKGICQAAKSIGKGIYSWQMLNRDTVASVSPLLWVIDTVANPKFTDSEIRRDNRPSPAMLRTYGQHIAGEVNDAIAFLQPYKKYLTSRAFVGKMGMKLNMTPLIACYILFKREDPAHVNGFFTALGQEDSAETLRGYAEGKQHILGVVKLRIAERNLELMASRATNKRLSVQYVMGLLCKAWGLFEAGFERKGADMVEYADFDFQERSSQHQITHGKRKGEVVVTKAEASRITPLMQRQIPSFTEATM